jgi:sterol 3beta-glucosyltransferase
MRIALIALGSRGDVQPFIALALALQARGHTVRVAATSDYEDLVAAYGIPYAPLIGSIAEHLDHAAVLDALDSAGRRSPLRFARDFQAQVTPILHQLAADCLLACTGAEAIVSSTLGLYLAESVAERLQIPLIPAHMHPYGSTAQFPDVSFRPPPRWWPLPGLYHRMTHLLAQHGLWQVLHQSLNAARRDALGLPPLSRLRCWRRTRQTPPLALYGFSTRILSRPTDWPDWRQITGFWQVDPPTDWQVPSELERFLAEEPAPVYLGFGSVLAGRDPQAIVAALDTALERTGRRGLVYQGAWEDLQIVHPSERLLAIGDVPHQWLFARVAAVVCHGGAGTVAAALRAGAPLIVVPAYGDQRLWGRRVAELGVGSAPIERRVFDAAHVAAALDTALAPDTRARAAQLALELAAEDGAVLAAEVLESVLDSMG